MWDISAADDSNCLSRVQATFLSLSQLVVLLAMRRRQKRRLLLPVDQSLPDFNIVLHIFISLALGHIDIASSQLRIAYHPSRSGRVDKRCR